MEEQPLAPAERVAQLIKELDMTTYQFGKATGISHQTLSNVLTSKNKPGLDTLQAIARAYPEAAVFLLTGIGAPFPNGRYNEKPAPYTEKPAEPAGEAQMPATVKRKIETPTAEELRGSMVVVADSPEMKQVKSERDNLRRQVDALLAVLHGKPFAPQELSGTVVAVGGKIEASPEAADWRDVVDEIAEEFPIAYHIVAKQAPGFKPAHLRLA